MGSYGSITACPFEIFWQCVLLVPHAYENRRMKDIALYTCIIVSVFGWCGFVMDVCTMLIVA